MKEAITKLILLTALSVAFFGLRGAIFAFVIGMFVFKS